MEKRDKKNGKKSSNRDSFRAFSPLYKIFNLYNLILCIQRNSFFIFRIVAEFSFLFKKYYLN